MENENRKASLKFLKKSPSNRYRLSTETESICSSAAQPPSNLNRDILVEGNLLSPALNSLIQL